MKRCPVTRMASPCAFAALQLSLGCCGLLTIASCAPPLADEPWRIAEPRILAVVAEPPDVEPGHSVRLEAVIGSPDGPLDGAELKWLRCEGPPPFGDERPLSQSCLDRLADAPVGSMSVEVAIPPDACAVFGPDVAKTGERPRDADATGGYFQPVAVGLGASAAVAFVRLRCQPAGVDAATAQAFRSDSRANTNPSCALEGTVAGQRADWSALPAGAELELRADWTASPEEEALWVDPSTFELTTGLERYGVSWFVTQGTLDRARSSTGQGRWRLPSAPGEAVVWAVLRDSRGGVGVAVRRARWSD
jgi:hypothetical protein